MNSFLDDYEIYSSGDEVPPIYHKWAAYSCLSHLIGPRIWTDQKKFIVYPNLYVVLVGPPGLTKTTALRCAQRLVTRSSHIAQAPSSITKEAIIKIMGEENSRCKSFYKLNDKPIRYSQLAIFASEFINLLNAGGNPIGMIDFFTEIWDNVDTGYQDTTKNKGDFAIERPFISILGCMTDATIKNLITQKVVSAGMTRRVLFVTGKPSGVSVAFPEESHEQQEAKERCLAHAIRLKDISGAFTWTQPARDVYKLWYDTNTIRRDGESNEILQQFLRTKPELIIKVAMLEEIAKPQIELVLTEHSISKAIELITEIEYGGPSLFEGSGRNPLSSVATEIERYIMHSDKPIAKKQLYIKFRGDASFQDIDLVLESLRRIDRIRKLPINPQQPLVELFASPKVAESLSS